MQLCLINILSGEGTVQAGFGRKGFQAGAEATSTAVGHERVLGATTEPSGGGSAGLRPGRQERRRGASGAAELRARRGFSEHFLLEAS